MPRVVDKEPAENIGTVRCVAELHRGVTAQQAAFLQQLLEQRGSEVVASRRPGLLVHGPSRLERAARLRAPRLVSVCILDSGVEGGHPLVGALESSVTVAGDEDAPLVVEDEAVDVSGHGTACAGIWATGRSPDPCNLFTKPGSSSPFAYS
jgi:subtilisin family serine protease